MASPELATTASSSRSTPTAPARGNPGPGRLGAILTLAAASERELSGGEPLTTNNRMELMAAIEALEALKRPGARRTCTPTASTCARASPSGCRLEGARLADRRQEAGEEPGPVGAAGRRRRAATRSSGAGSRATPATSSTSAPTSWPDRKSQPSGHPIGPGPRNSGRVGRTSGRRRSPGPTLSGRRRRDQVLHRRRDAAGAVRHAGRAQAHLDAGQRADQHAGR